MKQPIRIEAQMFFGAAAAIGIFAGARLLNGRRKS